MTRDALTPEHQLCDDLLTAWLTHGLASDEFRSLLNQATLEFDTRTIIFVLASISSSLMTCLGDIYPGGLPQAQAMVRDHFTHPTEEIRNA